MKKETFNKLLEAEKFCIKNDKSLEFTIQYLQDYCNVSFDCVMNYLHNRSEGEK